VCDCHIGYVHLESLPLYDVFAGGVLERVPAALPPAVPPTAPLAVPPAVTHRAALPVTVL
jgi:hypothetical protein